MCSGGGAVVDGIYTRITPCRHLQFPNTVMVGMVTRLFIGPTGNRQCVRTDPVYPLQLARISSWVLPPLSNSWIIIIVWLYIALNRTPNIDCYWVGAVPKLVQ